MSLPKRLLFLLRSVCALPNASRTGLDSSTLSCSTEGGAGLGSQRSPEVQLGKLSQGIGARSGFGNRRGLVQAGTTAGQAADS